MRSCLTAVLEKHVMIPVETTTEPYELPWAAEARFFVHSLAVTDGQGMTYHTEISPDGLHWCDSGVVPQRAENVGVISWAVAGFGQWLRVRCVPDTPDRAGAGALVRIYLVGKS